MESNQSYAEQVSSLLKDGVVGIIFEDEQISFEPNIGFIKYLRKRYDHVTGVNSITFNINKPL